MRRVVVTGLGVVSPVGCGVEPFWQGLASGRNGIARIDRFDSTDYVVQSAGQVRDLNADDYVAPKEQRRMDRFSIYAVSAASMALRDSGVDLGALDPARGGVMVTSGFGGLESVEAENLTMFEKGPRRVSPLSIPSMIVNMPSGQIAIQHQLKGPNLAVVTACASSLHAIGLAARLIRYGDADLMIAGGSEAALTKLGIASFAAMRALSTRNDSPETACRPFDRDRDGFVMGEGAGVLVLEEYEAAKRRGARIYAEVAGFGMSADANHITAPCEDGDGARRAMCLALSDAKLNPEDVGYVNAHGTSTPLNDKIETLAIKRAFGEVQARRLMVSSTKSMTGHMLGAAGGVESIACVKALETGVVPPTINYLTPDPECDLDYVPNTAREVRFRAVLNNAFGFGGHNGCIAFTRV